MCLTFNNIQQHKYSNKQNWRMTLSQWFEYCLVGRGLDNLMTVNLARYRPTGEHVAIRRIDLESCTNDMVTYLQVWIAQCLQCAWLDSYVTLLPIFHFSALLRIYLFASLVVCYILCNLLLPIFRSDIIRCSFLSVSQGELHVSKLFHHPSILPYKSVFIAENELWVITPFMAYGKKSNFLPYCCFSYVMQLNLC